MTCEEVRLALGAHALGRWEPTRRWRSTPDLATCEVCGAELLDLEGVASFLGKVSERDVELVVQPARQVLDRLLNAVASAARRGRALLAVAASVAVMAVGVTVWMAPSRRTSMQSAASPHPPHRQPVESEQNRRTPHGQRADDARLRSPRRGRPRGHR